MVSIHAPAWGATSVSDNERRPQPVSIHAPAWGATTTARLRQRPQRGFNPRTRVGCDVRPAHYPPLEIRFQSTHPRGVRRTLLFSLMAWEKFQSTHPRGVRHPDKRREDALIEFQSTHPRGVRHIRTTIHACSFRVSIHAPAWGATYWMAHTHHTRLVSIHAPAWGATNCGSNVVVDCVVSIHAPAWGATYGGEANFETLEFQSTHPRGVRPPGLGGCL